MEKNNRNRAAAIVLIVAGLFLLADNHISFFTVVALLFLMLGVKRVRSDSPRKGFVFLAIGLVMLFGGHFSLILAIILISLGLFYIKSRQLHRSEAYIQKQRPIDSIRWGKDPWIVRDCAIWNVIGEIQIDLTFAIFEQKETTLVLQGVIADVDIIVPEGVGVSVTASVLFGQLDVGPQKEAGVTNKIVWQSPDYEYCDQQVKLIISYIVGDIDIKIV
ncbi:cell wall-active antibiotics response protein LiaF [Paenibacillus hamazuiensis]|uniref:cell wall-active antibiotics response protein LiaF n=1 Tax=Paenibacillus hamazuiensis TaxID=2936508 RepID=UPI00200FD208|nr:cell wall-active antibiotics response protein LiaF [Paenibacillus hamazuiensis]